MRVKICGITTAETAEGAAKAGADFLGLMFAPSKRRLTPEEAAKISTHLPEAVQKVGVFVNASYDTIINTAKTAGLDMIQLHGNEPPSLAEALPYPVIKAFRIGEHHSAAIKRYPCDYYLVDSPKGSNWGGNGTTFDWRRLADQGLDVNKMILAGGLSPENVREAVETAGPAAVDVSSGVETNSTKDLHKIQQFIKQAKLKG